MNNNIKCPICNKELTDSVSYGQEYVSIYICDLNKHIKHIYVKVIPYINPSDAEEKWVVDKFIFYNFYNEAYKKMLYLYRIEPNFSNEDFYDLNPYESGWEELPIRIEPTDDIEKIKGILLFT